MSEQIKFNDQALTKAVQESAFSFANFRKHLDQTSADIKVLEKWLQDVGVCFSVYVEVPDQQETYRVGWDNYDDEWRLVCSIFSDGSGPQLRRLIEMPVRVRLLCRPRLPILIRELAKLLPTQSSQDQEVQKNNTSSEDDLEFFANVNTPETTAKPKSLFGQKSKAPKPRASQSDDLESIFASEDEIPF